MKLAVIIIGFIATTNAFPNIPLVGSGGPLVGSGGDIVSLAQSAASSIAQGDVSSAMAGASSMAGSIVQGFGKGGIIPNFSQSFGQGLGQGIGHGVTDNIGQQVGKLPLNEIFNSLFIKLPKMDLDKVFTSPDQFNGLFKPGFDIFSFTKGINTFPELLEKMKTEIFNVDGWTDQGKEIFTKMLDFQHGGGLNPTELVEFFKNIGLSCDSLDLEGIASQLTDVFNLFFETLIEKLRKFEEGGNFERIEILLWDVLDGWYQILAEKVLVPDSDWLKGFEGVIGILSGLLESLGWSFNEDQPWNAWIEKIYIFFSSLKDLPRPGHLGKPCSDGDDKISSDATAESSVSLEINQPEKKHHKVLNQPEIVENTATATASASSGVKSERPKGFFKPRIGTTIISKKHDRPSRKDSAKAVAQSSVQVTQSPEQNSKNHGDGESSAVATSSSTSGSNTAAASASSELETHESPKPHVIPSKPHVIDGSHGGSHAIHLPSHNIPHIPWHITLPFHHKQHGKLDSLQAIAVATADVKPTGHDHGSSGGQGNGSKGDISSAKANAKSLAESNHSSAHKGADNTPAVTSFAESQARAIVRPATNGKSSHISGQPGHYNSIANSPSNPGFVAIAEADAEASASDSTGQTSQDDSSQPQIVTSEKASASAAVTSSGSPTSNEGWPQQSQPQGSSSPGVETQTVAEAESVVTTENSENNQPQQYASNSALSSAIAQVSNSQGNSAEQSPSSEAKSTATAEISESPGNSQPDYQSSTAEATATTQISEEPGNGLKSPHQGLKHQEQKTNSPVAQSSATATSEVINPGPNNYNQPEDNSSNNAVATATAQASERPGNSWQQGPHKGPNHQQPQKLNKKLNAPVTISHSSATATSEVISPGQNDNSKPEDNSSNIAVATATTQASERPGNSWQQDPLKGSKRQQPQKLNAPVTKAQSSAAATSEVISPGPNNYNQPEDNSSNIAVATATAQASVGSGNSFKGPRQSPKQYQQPQKTSLPVTVAQSSATANIVETIPEQNDDSQPEDNSRNIAVAQASAEAENLAIETGPQDPDSEAKTDHSNLIMVLAEADNPEQFELDLKKMMETMPSANVYETLVSPDEISQIFNLEQLSKDALELKPESDLEPKIESGPSGTPVPKVNYKNLIEKLQNSQQQENYYKPQPQLYSRGIQLPTNFFKTTPDNEFENRLLNHILQSQYFPDQRDWPSEQPKKPKVILRRGRPSYGGQTNGQWSGDQAQALIDKISGGSIGGKGPLQFNTGSGPKSRPTWSGDQISDVGSLFDKINTGRAFGWGNENKFDSETLGRNFGDGSNGQYLEQPNFEGQGGGSGGVGGPRGFRGPGGVSPVGGGGPRNLGSKNSGSPGVSGAGGPGGFGGPGPVNSGGAVVPGGFGGQGPVKTA